MNLEEIYAAKLKVTIYQILSIFIAHFFWYIIPIVIVTAISNTEINVTIYIKLSIR